MKSIKTYLNNLPIMVNYFFIPHILLWEMIIIKEIIPYEKEIKFDTKISEITSISLEHEESYNNDDIEGNFLISGDYKEHQISIDKKDFNFKIPFTIELSESIDKNSIQLDINDFTYDIKDDDTLKITVELEFNYNLIQKEEEREEELDRQIDELIATDETKEETKEEIKEEVIQEVKEENKQQDTYVTYHVHLVAQDETIDSICLKYNIDKNTLHEYNDFEELNINDKLLIPIKDE